jgi:Zn-dependent M28 family amino/carboxypeptidase
LRNFPVKPAGTDGDFFQTFDKGSRNILVLWPGSDPELRDEVIVVGAHYDHVGDGSRGHILGKKGVIYNGADDNASGVSVLLETIEAISTTPIDTRRSILFAFWDGEELGLLGSMYWLEHPTIPRCGQCWRGGTRSAATARRCRPTT